MSKCQIITFECDISPKNGTFLRDLRVGTIWQIIIRILYNFLANLIPRSMKSSAGLDFNQGYQLGLKIMALGSGYSKF